MHKIIRQKVVHLKNVATLVSGKMNGIMEFAYNLFKILKHKKSFNQYALGIFNVLIQSF